MQRVAQFAFRVNEQERRAIALLAARLQRSQSDAIRFVVAEAARQLVMMEQAAKLQPSAENTISTEASGDKGEA